MSKILDREMTAAEMKRRITESRQHYTADPAELEEAQSTLHMKMLEETDERLERVNTVLDGFAKHLDRIGETLRDATQANQGFQRAHRRYAQSVTLFTLLLVVTASWLAYTTWTQLDVIQSTRWDTPPPLPRKPSTLTGPAAQASSPVIAHPVEPTGVVPIQTGDLQIQPLDALQGIPWAGLTIPLGITWVTPVKTALGVVLSEPETAVEAAPQRTDDVSPVDVGRHAVRKVLRSMQTAFSNAAGMASAARDSALTVESE